VSPPVRPATFDRVWCSRVYRRWATVAGEPSGLTFDVSSHYTNLLDFGRLTHCVPDSRRPRIVEIVVKVSTAESARSGFQGLETLWVAGLRAPSRNQAPRPLGIIEQQGACDGAGSRPALVGCFGQ
jgi:hypothetical protein